MNTKQYVLMLVLAMIAGLVGGVVSSWLFIGVPVFAQKIPRPAKTVRAEKFVVVNKDGQPRIWLGPLGLLIPNTKDGQPGAAFGVTPDGAVGLEFYGGKGEKSRIKLALSPDGAPSVILSDKGGNRRAVLSLGVNEEPGLSFLDKDGNPSVMLFAINGASQLSLQHKKGIPGILMSSLPRGEAVLSISGSREKGRIDVNILADGTPSLQLYDKDGNERAVLGQTELEVRRTGSTEKRSASSLVLFDKEGKVLWRAP